jgi:hypothetical protein
MNIRGKEYMEVKDRVMVFRKNNPEWAIITQIVENNEQTGSVIFKVTIEDENGRIRGTGHAHEFKGDKTSMVNKTSHLENCETSAIGRALGSLGIGIESSYATYDEVLIAKDKEARAEERKIVKEGSIKQSNDATPEVGKTAVNLGKNHDVVWPGKKKHSGKTISWVAENDLDYLKKSLKENADQLESVGVLDVVKHFVNLKTDFPKAK